MLAVCPLQHPVGLGDTRRAHLTLQGRRGHTQISRAAKKGVEDRDDPDKPNPGVGLKAVWYGSELFGNVIGMFQNNAKLGESGCAMEKMTRTEVVESIRADYAENYFVSGKGNMSAYADDCYFADPFAGFNGVERFKKNISNLGAFTEDVKLDVYEFNELGNFIETKWRFSCILTLPWRPRLAAGGSTVHVLDKDTNKVVKHLENWDAEPSRVLKSLLKPATRPPQNDWETFFLALSGGDAKTMWFTSSKYVTIGWLPIVLVSLGTKAATGEGLQGVFLGTVEGFAYLFVLAGIVTEAVKFSTRSD